MKNFSKVILLTVALVGCLLTAQPCCAARKPLWASHRAVEKINSARTNDTYRLYYADTFGLNAQNNLDSIVGQLAARYGLSADLAQVDTVGHVISFGKDTWFKYKVVSEKTVFCDDVSQNWDWMIYQLFAVSEKNTEPQYDDFEMSEPWGATSLAQSIIPGLGQWNKKQKDKAVVIWATEAASIAGAVWLFDRDHYYKGFGWTSKAKSYRQMGYLAVGVAAGMYIYNLIDAYCCKGGEKVRVKKHDVSTALVPFASPQGAGMTLAFHF